MATKSQEILLKGNTTNASAVPSSLKVREIAINALDRSLFTNDGNSIVKLYTGTTKWFDVNGNANNALKADSVAWSGISGKPTTFTPSAHTHAASDVSGLPTSLKNPYKLTFGSKTYDGSAAATITASDLGALTAHQSIYALTLQVNGTSKGVYNPASAVKTINIAVPTKTSDITNDSGFITSASIPTALKNPYAVEIKANGVSLGTYDGSAAATFNLSAANVGAANRVHSHTASEISGLPTNLSAFTNDVGFVTVRQKNGFSYNNLNSLYVSNALIYRIDLTDVQVNIWTMLFIEVSLRQHYSHGYAGKILINLYHGTAGDFTAFNATILGNLNNINVYGSDRRYIYIYASMSYSTISVDRVLVGDNAINYDLSNITIEKVDSLPDTYQTATIYNGLHTGNFTKSLVEGVLTGDITSHTHNYLPLSGGTMTGSVTMQGMNTNLIRNITYTGTSSWARDLMNLQVDGISKFSISAMGDYTLGASNNGIIYAYIGCNSYNGLNLRISKSSLSWGDNPILHAGNYNSYAPTLTGTGASGTWGISITGNAATVGGFSVTSANSKPWGTIPAITKSGYMDVGKHFEFHYDNTTGSDYSTVLGCTGNYGNIVSLPSTNGTLALLTDNVASATKLQTPRTIWGQRFDGSADVTGNIHLGNGSDFEIGTGYDGSNTYRYNKIVFGAGGTGLQYISGRWTGGNIVVHNFKVGLNDTTALAITNNGNILIGTTTDSGYKLDVDGTSRAKLYYAKGLNSYGYKWNNGPGGLNVEVPNDTGQTPLVVGYRTGTSPVTAGVDRLFALELLDTGDELRYSWGGAEKHVFYNSGNVKFLGKLTVTGDSDVNGDAHITGNLIVDGEVSALVA